MSFPVRLLGVCWPSEIKHSFWLLFSTWRDSHNGRLFSAASLPDLPPYTSAFPPPITQRDPGKDENLAKRLLLQQEKAEMVAKMQQLKVAYAELETREMRVMQV